MLISTVLIYARGQEHLYSGRRPGGIGRSAARRAPPVSLRTYTKRSHNSYRTKRNPDRTTAQQFEHRTIRRHRNGRQKGPQERKPPHRPTYRVCHHGHKQRRSHQLQSSRRRNVNVQRRHNDRDNQDRQCRPCHRQRGQSSNINNRRPSQLTRQSVRQGTARLLRRPHRAGRLHRTK